MDKNLDLPYVSVIIPNFNGSSLLRMFLPKVIQETRYPNGCIEIIVVDNGSTDNSCEVVEKFYPSVRLIKLNKNYGYGRACNVGAKVAKGEFLVFLNNDILVTKDWLIELVNIAVREKDVGICGSKILFLENPSLVDYAGGYLHILGGGISLFIWKEDHTVLIRSPTDVGYVCGACLLVKREVFKKLGGFDNDYFMYSDEGDLCWRCWLQGYRVVFVPSSVVYHKKEASIKRGRSEREYYLYGEKGNPFVKGRILSDLRVYYGNRNSLSNIVKNLEFKNILIGIIGSFIYSILQVVILQSQKKPKYTLLLCKAWLSFLKELRNTWKKRMSIQRNRLKSDKDLFSKGILIGLRQLIRIVMNKGYHGKH